VAIVPLAALLSRATEAVAAKTGDTIGGLLDAALGNLTELLIALAALRAGPFIAVIGPKTPTLHWNNVAISERCVVDERKINEIGIAWYGINY
jgi:calcium/proton exchanger cax